MLGRTNRGRNEVMDASLTLGWRRWGGKGLRREIASQVNLRVRKHSNGLPPSWRDGSLTRDR